MPFILIPVAPLLFYLKNRAFSLTPTSIHIFLWPHWYVMVNSSEVALRSTSHRLLFYMSVGGVLGGFVTHWLRPPCLIGY